AESGAAASRRRPRAPGGYGRFPPHPYTIGVGWRVEKMLSPPGGPYVEAPACRRASSGVHWRSSLPSFCLEVRMSHRSVAALVLSIPLFTACGVLPDITLGKSA